MLAKKHGRRITGFAPDALDLLMRLNNDLAAALLNDETIAPVL